MDEMRGFLGCVMLAGYYWGMAKRTLVTSGDESTVGKLPTGSYARLAGDAEEARARDAERRAAMNERVWRWCKVLDERGFNGRMGWVLWTLGVEEREIRECLGVLMYGFFVAKSDDLVKETPSIEEVLGVE